MKASPCIKERIVAALVQIDYEMVSKWAEARRLAVTHFRSLVEQLQVAPLIDAEVAKDNVDVLGSWTSWGQVLHLALSIIYRNRVFTCRPADGHQLPYRSLSSHCDALEVRR
ncbi:hypothetical protein [Pseudorhodoferax sp.]|uniref:hypothetical protein n=1 Tax=Pseudorhodoferax sp. TaxID=1993553 RepID=UPI003FA6C56C